MESRKRQFLEELYKSYSTDIFNIAYSKLNHDKDKANEVVQETFAIACMKVDTIYPAETPLRWLLCVQSNIVKREKFRLSIRKDGKYNFFTEVNIDTLPAEQLPIEEVEFYEGSIFDDLKKVLSEREMKFIEERYIKDKKYKEVADSLQISESACTSLGNRIHKKIIKYLLDL
ncbi:sigma-70 family RNA polymerase sigma factor [Lachnospiraceae bacterium 46-61]